MKCAKCGRGVQPDTSPLLARAIAHAINITLMVVLMTTIIVSIKCMLIFIAYRACIWLGAPDLLNLDPASSLGTYFPPRAD